MSIQPILNYSATSLWRHLISTETDNKLYKHDY